MQWWHLSIFLLAFVAYFLTAAATANSLMKKVNSLIWFSKKRLISYSNRPGKSNPSKAYLIEVQWIIAGGGECSVLTNPWKHVCKGRELRSKQLWLLVRSESRNFKSQVRLNYGLSSSWRVAQSMSISIMEMLQALAFLKIKRSNWGIHTQNPIVEIPEEVIDK